ncbi:MAG TPA: alkaline phosphatase family protein [Nitrososphaeraceae archaeon]|nr:alkaline phosphatase family protein [Nitrososphaeraceae archaeon]
MSENQELRMLYVLLDGIGDLPNPELDGKTPLEAANTPNIDVLARKGKMGQVISVGEGISPQSDIAVFNMLGYDFQGQKYAGRGIVEIIGSGVEFRDGDLALRGNFATLDNSKIIDRRAGRDIIKQEAGTICSFLEDNVKFDDPDVSVKITPTISHRVIIKFRHIKKSLSDKITNTDPAYGKLNGIGIAKTDIENMAVQESISEDNTESSILSAKIVNEFTRKSIALLKDHQVNLDRISKNKKPMSVILLRDAGNSVPHLQPINEKYGISTSCLVDMPVEIGIAKIIGMDLFCSQKIDDYRQKGVEVAKILDVYNLVYVHIKGPDEYGHDGDALGKKSNIELIDENFFGVFLKLVTGKHVVVISGDHSTPCIKKSHTDDPIPLLVSGNGIKSDGSQRFTESWASKGSMGTLKGSQVISYVLKMMSTQKNK